MNCRRIFALVALGMALWGSAFAAEGGRRARGDALDRPYHHSTHTIDLGERSELGSVSRSRVNEVIELQTPVRSQGERGTCVVFSVTAYLESMIVAQGRSRRLNLSEEWLNYVITNRKVDDGSTGDRALQRALERGMALEALFHYEPEEWTSLSSDRDARARCGKVPAELLKSCLVSHRDPRLLTADEQDLSSPKSPLYDPEFLKARESADEFKKDWLQGYQVVQLKDTDAVKRSLLQDEPVVLDMEFHYGAWNHGEGEELGIDVDPVAYSAGIVNYPEKGSVDLANSSKDPTGHSVLAVGYDDDLVITARKKMVDGTTRTFTYKGVILFKNSWGTQSFGRNFEYRGVRHPGYGMMPQKYAADYGTFFKLVRRQ